MAIREIRKAPDDILNKKSREITVFDERLFTLLDDMADTMYEANGVGLAAVQVGVLKRACVIDVGDGLIELINPVIVEESGTQSGTEGCLSFPGKWGIVTRPNYVTVEAFDRKGNKVKYSGEGLLARALCHETEHLDGNTFVQKAERFVEPDEE